MFLQDLSDKVWNTKNARYVAYRRMKRSRVSSTAFIAFLSASIIGINLLSFLPDYNEQAENISVISIILSVFSLVISLLVSLLQYESKEKNYHGCGLELDKLNQQIRMSIMYKNETLDDDRDYLNKYYQILEKYNLNHTEFDHAYTERKEEHCTWEKRLVLWLRWYIFDVNTLYWLLAFILPIISFFVLEFSKS